MATLDETSGRLRLVASFRDPEAAREAMIDLEAMGIERSDA
jgi:hypothetical protein